MIRETGVYIKYFEDVYPPADPYIGRFIVDKL